MAKIKDITGKRFGRLVAQEVFGKEPSGSYKWKCLCDCGNEKTVRKSHLSLGNTKSCGCLQYESHIKINTGRINNLLHPSNSPTIQEIYWASGLYEGEGSVNGNRGFNVSIGQKNKWVLDKLQSLFGGSIKESKYSSGFPSESNKSPMYYLGLSGTRARGFIMTIFKLLSPRRQQQAKLALLNDRIIFNKLNRNGN
jgi:hypothetical protein